MNHDHPREITVWASPEAPTRLTVPGGKVPEYVVCKMEQIREGVYQAKPVTLDLWIKKRPGLCRRFGIELSDETLLRLGRAGFVKIHNPAPQVVLVNIQSLLAHLEATQSPRFWTRERRRRYLLACDDLQRVSQRNLKPQSS